MLFHHAAATTPTAPAPGTTGSGQMVRQRVDDHQPALHRMSANPALDAVLKNTWPILLDFDGPVTHLFVDGRNRMVADRMRAALPDGVNLPEDLRDTHDPLIILRWAAQRLDQQDLDRIETACVEGEKAAAVRSVPTPGAAELLTACARVGRPVIVVSNNAEAPIHQFLTAHSLDRLVSGIVARVPGRPELMKPDPTSVRTALDRLGANAEDCAMIGDSVTDIEVCTATGVRSIGFAKTIQRGHDLRVAGADAVVDSVLDIARHAGLGNAERDPSDRPRTQRDPRTGPRRRPAAGRQGQEL